jgi:hypothetical protein
MSDDVLVNSISDGSIRVKTFITASSKVYYVVTVSYLDTGQWVNQTFTVLDNEVASLMCLLRRALLFPKKAYAELEK